MFLAEVVLLEQKDTWLEEGQQEAKRLGVASPKFLMH
jgi:hypothetical protein